MKARSSIILLAATLLCGVLLPQSASDPNEGLQLEKDPSGNTSSLSWWGRTGKSYYIKHSKDLIHWAYVPTSILQGADEVIEMGVSSEGDRGFFRLDITDGDVLPADWLNRYNLGAGSSGPEDDPDGDGFTNAEEYSLGLDPSDFYNGTLPTLQWLSGASQWGQSGAILSQPLAATASSIYGDCMAPITFAVSAGGAQISLNGTSGWSSTVAARCTVFDNDTGRYKAQVYIKLPSAVGGVSTITATVASGEQSLVLTTYAGVFNPNASPPAGLTVDAIGTDSVELHWTPWDASLPTTIEMSEDGGVSWSYIGVASPGASSAIIKGLVADREVRFRLLTGGVPEGGSDDPVPVFQRPLTTKVPPAGEPVTTPGTAASATPLAATKLWGRQATYDGVKFGYPGFITPNNRYLQKVSDITSVDTDNDADGGHAVDTSTMDTQTGIESTVRVGQQGATYFSGTPVPSSDTTATEHGEDDEGEEGVETSDSIHTLSNLYTTQLFKSNVEGWVPAFAGDYSENTDTASIKLSDDELTYKIRKLQFKWKVNKDPDLVVRWLEVFTPDDGGNPVIESKSWTSNGAAESPVFTIDPTQKNDKKNGTYKVVQIQLLQPALDQTGIYTFGDPVPTNAPRFSRWRYGFTEPGGQLETDWIKDDQDRVIVRITGDIIDSTTPGLDYVNVKVAGITDVSGRTADDGLLQMTKVGDNWESEPFIFVADKVDTDDYLGKGTTPNDVHDQTRLASFGASISVKALFKGQNAAIETPVTKMGKALHTVQVDMTVLCSDLTPLQPDDKTRAQAYFDTAKLFYRQIGVDLVQVGGIADMKIRSDFNTIMSRDLSMKDTTVGPNDGKTFAQYLAGLSQGSASIKVFVSAMNIELTTVDAINTVGWAPYHGDYAFVNFYNSGLEGADILAHEIGHSLGAHHPDEESANKYPHRLMNKATKFEGEVTDAKRFCADDQGKFVGDKHYK